MTGSVLLGVAGVILLAGFAQTVSGFGFALVAVPLLSVLTDPVTAVVAATVLGMVMSLSNAVQLREHVQFSALKVILPTGVLGMPLGLLALKVVDPRWLSWGIGVVVIVFTVLLVRGLHLRGRGPAVAAGVVSGVLLTSTGMNGPPLVIAFQGQRLSPAAFRGTLQAAFSVHDLIAILGFVVAGVFGADVVRVVAAGLVPMLLGWGVGNRTLRHIDAARFRWIVLGLLLATGVTSLVNGIVG